MRNGISCELHSRLKIHCRAAVKIIWIGKKNDIISFAVVFVRCIVFCLPKKQNHTKWMAKIVSNFHFAKQRFWQWLSWHFSAILFLHNLKCSMFEFHVRWMLVFHQREINGYVCIFAVPNTLYATYNINAHLLQSSMLAIRFHLFLIPTKFVQSSKWRRRRKQQNIPK